MVSGVAASSNSGRVANSRRDQQGVTHSLLSQTRPGDPSQKHRYRFQRDNELQQRRLRLALFHGEVL